MSKDLELQVSGPFAFLKIPNITILRCHCYKHLEVSRGLREVKEQVEKMWTKAEGQSQPSLRAYSMPGTVYMWYSSVLSSTPKDRWQLPSLQLRKLSLSDRKQEVDPDPVDSQLWWSGGLIDSFIPPFFYSTNICCADIWAGEFDFSSEPNFLPPPHWAPQTDWVFPLLSENIYWVLAPEPGWHQEMKRLFAGAQQGAGVVEGWLQPALNNITTHLSLKILANIIRDL